MRKYAGCLSVKGNYRKKNQDRACCLSSSKKGILFAVGCVCDGIGSFAQSEIAAEMIRVGLERWFLGMEPLYPENIDEESLIDDLDMTIRELNELIWIYRKENGIDIGEEALTLPAKLEICSEDRKNCLLTIHEGKFHQVKRMFQSAENEVVFLKRMSMGSLTLDKALETGQYRPLTQEEIERLKTNA